MGLNHPTKRLVVAFFLAAPLGAASADDETEPASKEEIQIAVLDVLGSGPVDPQYVEGLSGVLAAEVASRPELAVTTSADIRQILGFEAERQLLGCDGSSCMAEIGGALGVDYLISAEVSRVGANWLLNAGLVDVKNARTVHRISRRTRDEDELIDILIEATQEILVQLGLEAAAPVAHHRPTASRGRRSLTSNVALGVGAAGVVGGGILYGTSWATHSAHQAGQEGEPAITWAEAQAAQRNAAIGVGLLAGGAAIATASFFLPRTAGGGPALAFVPVDGGGLLVMGFLLEGF